MFHFIEIVINYAYNIQCICILFNSIKNVYVKEMAMLLNTDDVNNS
jgi:hypothetical protein